MPFTTHLPLCLSFCPRAYPSCLRGLSAVHNAPPLGARLGELVRCGGGPGLRLQLAVVSNYMVDLPWLLSACPDLTLAEQVRPQSFFC